MSARLGIFICGCGPNIGEKISTADLAAFARTLPEVAEVQTHGLLCSAEGQALLRQRIRELSLDRVVVAACSPREHEATFRTVLEKAGLNPFLLQMANLREQCVWVTADPQQAARKARALLQAAVWRVREHEALCRKEVEVNPDVLVLGAGVAGLSAALHLAGPGRRVHLVERGPFLGGKTVLYEKVFPGMECGACLVNPWIDRVLHEETIKVHLTSELEQVKGFFGNFEVGLRRRARGVDPERCVGCGSCQGVCPVRVPHDHLLGLVERPAIYLPFPGAQPAVAILDRDHCLNRHGQPCEACRGVCPTGAILTAEEDQFLEIKVGAIVLATGFDEENRPSAGEEVRSGRVLSGLETEILLNSSGPTSGRLPWPEGLETGAVGIMACRSVPKDPPRFSRLNPLPGSFLKLACQIREQVPQAAITIYYNELNLPAGEDLSGFGELMGGAGISWQRLIPGDSLRVGSSAGRNGVEWADHSGVRRFKEFDLLIAAQPLTGSSGVSELAGKLRLPLNEDGFWKTLGARLEPVNTPAEGLYAVGCARGPRDIPAAVLDGLAAAGQIRSRLVPGERIALEPLSAAVTWEHCSGCRICLGNCPFLALEWDPEGESVRVNEVLCRGCGLCAVLCPSGAIRIGHFDRPQVTAEIRGLLHDTGQ